MKRRLPSAPPMRLAGRVTRHTILLAEAPVALLLTHALEPSLLQDTNDSFAGECWDQSCSEPPRPRVALPALV